MFGEDLVNNTPADDYGMNIALSDKVYWGSEWVEVAPSQNIVRWYFDPPGVPGDYVYGKYSPMGERLQGVSGLYVPDFTDFPLTLI